MSLYFLPPFSPLQKPHLCWLQLREPRASWSWTHIARNPNRIGNVWRYSIYIYSRRQSTNESDTVWLCLINYHINTLCRRGFNLARPAVKSHVSSGFDLQPKNVSTANGKPRRTESPLFRSQTTLICILLNFIEFHWRSLTRSCWTMLEHLGSWPVTILKWLASLSGTGNPYQNVLLCFFPHCHRPLGQHIH